MTHTILVADDDPHIREVICFALEKAGMRAQSATDGVQAVAFMRAQAADLIVLDIGMPEMDGLEACRKIREFSDAPILFLSARDEEIDRILGLEIGGDDYVTKPFSPRELVARIRAILKRARPHAMPDARKSLTHGALELDVDRHAVTFQNHAIAATALEFSILRALLLRPSMVFTREQILESAYGGLIHVSDRTIDSHIRNIRSKLKEAGCLSAIETVHGVGFRLGPCAAAP